MKKIKSYKGIMNDEFGIRVNGNESYKNITKDELNEIIAARAKAFRHKA